MLVEFDGLIYLAKDSTLTYYEFGKMFSNYDNWHTIVKEIDKSKKFESMLSERLKLKIGKTRYIAYWFIIRISSRVFNLHRQR